MRISKTLKQTRILFLIGLLDLLLTLILFNFFELHPKYAEFKVGTVVEKNYFFRTILEKNLTLFAGAKIFGLILCLAVIEFVRQKGLVKERVVKRYLKIGIVAYLFLYIALVINANLF